MSALRRVELYLSSAGNAFMVEIAEAFALAFTAAGLEAELLHDAPLSPQPPAGSLQMVVAPHEYFPLFARRRPDAAALEAALGVAWVLNVEQPGSQWFDLAARIACRARGALDISSAGAQALAHWGARAWHAPLPCSVHAAPAYLERPVDLLFLGSASPRRERILARCADALPGRRVELHLVSADLPRGPHTPGYAAGAARSHLLAATRILLDVQAGPRPYLAPHRANLALAHGCLLVAEEAGGAEPLRRGEHFVMAADDELPLVCRELLEQPDRAAEIAAQGTHFACEALAPAILGSSLAQLLEKQDGRPHVHLVGWTPESEEAARRAVLARLGEDLEQRERGEVPWTLQPNRLYHAAPPPAVSVVVTLFDYASVIGECLASVTAAASPALEVEVVVVDDASRDDSVRVAGELVERLDLPALLVCKQRNTGLADSRNIGFRLARAPAVFVLDADNLLLPGGLDALLGALKGEAAAAYGPLIRFDGASGEPLGLLSAAEWSVRGLVRGPYVDAMALFDRAAVLAVGGYSAQDLLEHAWGWEDYDLWLKLAAAGRKVVHVPRVVGRYRVHGGSMLGRTNLGTPRLARHLEQKFAALAARFPDLDRRFGFPRSEETGKPAVLDEVDLERLDPDVLRHRCNVLAHEVADLRTSLSWRWTAPLRLVYRLLTGRPH